MRLKSGDSVKLQRSNVEWIQIIPPWKPRKKRMNPRTGIAANQQVKLFFWGIVHNFKDLLLKQPAYAGGHIINNK